VKVEETPAIFVESISQDVGLLLKVTVFVILTFRIPWSLRNEYIFNRNFTRHGVSIIGGMMKYIYYKIGYIHKLTILDVLCR
jgi:hypothetical protein